MGTNAVTPSASPASKAISVAYNGTRNPQISSMLSPLLSSLLALFIGPMGSPSMTSRKAEVVRTVPPQVPPPAIAWTRTRRNRSPTRVRFEPALTMSFPFWSTPPSMSHSASRTLTVPRESEHPPS